MNLIEIPDVSYFLGTLVLETLRIFLGRKGEYLKDGWPVSHFKHINCLRQMETKYEKKSNLWFRVHFRRY